MSRSNAKGGEFERKICKRLSLWISDNMRDDLFWRSAMSGGRASLVAKRLPNKKRYNQCGDISAISREGQDFLDVFFIECKFLKSLQIDAWIYGHEGLLPKLWDKALQEAMDHDRVPLVIAKQNNKQELILTNDDGWFHLGQSCPRAVMPFRALFLRNEKRVVVSRFQDLLVYATWIDMRRHLIAVGCLRDISEKRKRITF